MSGRSIPSGLVTSVLHNGVGRYVCQLQRLTFKFCKEHGSSRGMRDFIENELLDFARRNPGIAVYLQPRRHRDPRLVGDYLNGNTHAVQCRNYNMEDICKWVELLRTQSGVKTVRLRKYWRTETPSIQGTWTPFTNKDTSLNLIEFPDFERFKAPKLEVTGTEQLLKMFEAAKNLSIIEKSDEVGKTSELEK